MLQDLAFLLGLLFAIDLYLFYVSEFQRKVLRYFNKYGFKDVKLSLYILDNNTSIDDIFYLEKYFIDSFSKDSLLNIEIKLKMQNNLKKK